LFFRQRITRRARRTHPAVSGPIHAANFAGFLSGCEILPGVPVNLDLENSALIRMQEVLAVRDAMSSLRPNLAGRPPGGADAAPVKVLALDNFEPELNPVPNTRRTGGY